jgi:MFS family permease
MVEVAPRFQRKRLPETVFRLGWVSLFTDVATEMSYPLIPAFLATMGAAGQWLGLVEGVAESVGAFVKYVAGAASDRSPVRKPFVLFGYTLSTLMRPLLSLAVAPWQVVALRASDRVGKGVRSAPRDALLAAAIDPEMRAYAFGFHQMMDNIGAVFGPLVAFGLARLAGFSLRAIFAAAIVPGLVAVATLAFGVRETPAPPKVDGAARSAKIPLDPHVKRYLVAVGVFSLGASADTFLLLRLSHQHLAVAYLPIAWLSLNAMKALTNLPGGRLADRIGHKRTLLIGWLLYAAAYAAFPFAHTIAATWGVMLAYGFYYGLTEGAEKALMSALAPKEQRGRAFGSLYAVTGAAVLPANAVFGALFDAHPEWAFGMGASCAALGAVLLTSFVPNPK